MGHQTLKKKMEKKGIQENFKLQLGVAADKPKTGFGSSNDGNTSRRFFEIFEITSEIIG